MTWGDFWSSVSPDMTLYVGYNNQSTDFYGQMYDMQGRNGAVMKVGTGTLALWDDVNWHGVTTIVGGGALQFNGDFGGGVLAGGDVGVFAASTVNGSGTIERNVFLYGGTLAGTLDVTGNVTANGGSINPGENGTRVGTVGTVTVGGNLNLGSSSTLNLDLGTSSDLIKMNGSGTTLSIGGGRINMNAGTGFGVGTYTLISGYSTFAGSTAWGNYTFNAPSTYSYHLNNTGTAHAVGGGHALDVERRQRRLEHQRQLDWRRAKFLQRVGEFHAVVGRSGDDGRVGYG